MFRIGDELASPVCMAVREFTAADGVLWRVWNTRPSRETAYDSAFRAGWLTFESPLARRRLAPIPAGWEEVSDERLGLMCRVAQEVARRVQITDAWSDEADSPR